MGTVTLQPSVKDNYVDNTYPTLNFGTQQMASAVWGPTFSEICRAIFEFAITWGTDIPAGSTITAATLYLYIYQCTGSQEAYKAQRLIRSDWHETQSNYDRYKTGSNWTSPGANGEGTD